MVSKNQREEGKGVDANNISRQRQRVPKSCLACLAGKRACDRNTPSCTRCWQKQRECVYASEPFEKPRLSGGKNKTNHRQTKSQSEETTLVSRLNEAAVSINPSQPNTLIETRYQDTLLPHDDDDNDNTSQQKGSPEPISKISWFGGSQRLMDSSDDGSKECAHTVQVKTALNDLLHPVSEVLFQDPDKGSSSIPDFRQQVLKNLPTPREAARFISSFRRFLRPALPALLHDKFLATAENFLLDTNKENREKIDLSWLAVSLMILAIGQLVAIEDKSDVDEGTSNGAWLLATPGLKEKPDTDAFLLASHRALGLVSFHSSPTLQTIYCQLLMGLYLLQTERIAAYWPIHGSIVRQAQAIGLHVEPKRVIPDEQIRRQVWWAIVQQDVLLSSVFRLPLAVSNISLKVLGDDLNSKLEGGSCYRAQAEFTILERRHLMDNMHQEWNREQLSRFKSDLFTWYMDKPISFRINIDDQSRIRGNELEIKMQGKTTAAIEATIDHFIQLQYTVLTLYRDRLQDSDVILREESYIICANVIHNFVSSLSVMVDLLGTIQVGKIWLRLFFTFHAGVTAAYLAVTRTGSNLGKQAKADLIQLTALCQRLPQRYRGLQTINNTFTVLLEQVEIFPLQQEAALLLHSSDTIGEPDGDTCPSLSECSVDANSCPSSMNTGPSVDMDLQYDGSMSHNDDLFGKVDEGWTGNFPGPFGPTDLLPGPHSSGEEILTFWNQYFALPSETDNLQFA